MKKQQRDELENHLQLWAEWSRSNSAGFTRSQLGVVGSGEFKSVCLVGDSVDAIERGMSQLYRQNENLHALIKWLWFELHVDEGVCGCAARLRISEKTFRRYRDQAYTVLFNELIRSGVLVGKKIAA